MTNEKNILAAQAAITHGGDGPVTTFVALMRTLRAVQAGADVEVYGNALAELLMDANNELPPITQF